MQIIAHEPALKPVLNRDPLVAEALAVLSKSLERPGALTIDNCNDAKDFARLKLGARRTECFAAMFISSNHSVLAFEELFYGNVNHVNVDLREFAKRALYYDECAAVVIMHNHPSGNPRPSNEDIHLTKVVAELLSLLGLQLVDHIVVSGGAELSVTSLRENGLY